MPPAATAPCRRLRSILGRFLDAPETNVAIFAFLLNLTWELAQVPLFAGMPSAEHWQAILVCGRATLGGLLGCCGRCTHAILDAMADRRATYWLRGGWRPDHDPDGVARDPGSPPMDLCRGHARHPSPRCRAVSSSSMGRPSADRGVVRSTPAHVNGRPNTTSS